MVNKVALLFNKDFLTLAGEEWKSSVFKSEMARRAQEFIPELKLDYLVKPGIAGVRAQVIDRNGNFIKEAIEIKGPLSYHITNYNSPGATGSPAYAAWLVQKLGSLGYLDLRTRKSSGSTGSWDFESITNMVSDSPSKPAPKAEEKAEREPGPESASSESPTTKKEPAPRKPSTRTSRKRPKTRSQNQG
jgi:hypothetical protein